MLKINSTKQITEANEVYTNQIVQMVDASLKMTEQMIVKEMLTSEELKRFFAVSETLDAYGVYEVSQSINEFLTASPVISSIYLYETRSGQVLTNNHYLHMDQFADKQFIADIYGSQVRDGWTDPRSYNEFFRAHDVEPVVSLVKRYPLNAKNQGIVVVNVRVGAILNIIHNITSTNISFVTLLDHRGLPFTSPGADERFASGREEGRPMSRIQSSYTGWTAVSGLKDEYIPNVLTSVSTWWMMAIFVVIVAGIVWLTYMTHRNYRPIRSIMNRIQTISTEKKEELVPQRNAADDEFNVIESALDNLIKNSIRYEKQQKEDLAYKKKQLLFELIQGGVPNPGSREELTRIELLTDFERLVVVLAEIDHYERFSGRYSSRDQNLFKFALQNVVQEFARNDGLSLWSEWIESEQLCGIFELREEESPERVAEICGKTVDWVRHNLKFSVTIGVGPTIQSIEDVVLSFEQSEQAVKMRWILGPARVIGHDEVPEKEMGDHVYRLLQGVRSIAQLYRLGDPDWHPQLAELFRQMEAHVLLKDDSLYLINSLVYYIRKEIGGLSEEFRQLCGQAVSEWSGGIEQAAALDELQSFVEHGLLDLQARMTALRQSHNNERLLQEVKLYIDRNYADANLSLNLLSEKFGLSPRYLSRIFKDVYGDKFVDYMTEVRINRAKELLRETADSVQEIAEKVGYVHAVSFNRAFKKITGLTPGDYRNTSG